jgi:hypothetical protein
MGALAYVFPFSGLVLLTEACAWSWLAAVVISVGKAAAERYE